jgi:hypothetical protein
MGGSQAKSERKVFWPKLIKQSSGKKIKLDKFKKPV